MLGQILQVMQNNDGSVIERQSLETALNHILIVELVQRGSLSRSEIGWWQAVPVRSRFALLAATVCCHIPGNAIQPGRELS